MSTSRPGEPRSGHRGVPAAPDPIPESLSDGAGARHVILCVSGNHPRARAPATPDRAGIALAVIGLKLFSLEPVLQRHRDRRPDRGATGAITGRSVRREVGVGSLALLVLFLIVITFLDQPSMLIGTLAAPAISLAVSAPRPYRPPAWLSWRALVIALAIAVIFLHVRFALARLFQDHPGGGCDPGRRASRPDPARSGGAGTGVLWSSFSTGGDGPSRAGSSFWLCLAEQGVTTPTFDAAANRATIESLACRIDRGRVTFYYHPDDGQTFRIHHLDAMWASLATGVPTINGYSGHAPRAWQRLLPGRFRAKTEHKEHPGRMGGDVCSCRPIEFSGSARIRPRSCPLRNTTEPLLLRRLRRERPVT